MGPLEHTIPGLPGIGVAAVSPARVGVTRRLSGDDVRDVCAAGWTRSKTQLDKIRADVRSMGQTHLFTEMESRKKSNYPEYYSCTTSSGGALAYRGGVDTSVDVGLMELRVSTRTSVSSSSQRTNHGYVKL